MNSKIGLSLYRQSLRVLRDIPIAAVRRKMAYNFRELFSIYKDAPKSKIDEVIKDGYRDLSLLKEILKGRNENVFNLFKTFENLNPQPSGINENISSEYEENFEADKQILPLWNKANNV